MLNQITLTLKEKNKPLIEFIRDSVFHREKIRSDEIGINKDYNVLAECDLSSPTAVLEIKTGLANVNK